MRVIGYLGSATSRDAVSPFVGAFRQGLSENGYLEGQNLAIEYRWTEGKYDRPAALAADLVDRKVDLIAAPNDVLAHGPKGATSTIPIVFIYGGAPVADGLVASFARPGGNLTGLGGLIVELTAKRLEAGCRFVVATAAASLSSLSALCLARPANRSIFGTRSPEHPLAS